MSEFDKIYQRAVSRKGGEAALKKLLPATIKSSAELKNIPDDRYLSGITKAIFKAGFVWKVIDNKWPGFEDAFWGFDIGRCSFMSPEEEDHLCQDVRIVRNRQKILTVPHNAVMINEIAKQHGSFGSFIADWPGDDFVGLLDYLGKHGSRLSGMTCQYFLRFIGKDGFILSRDGIFALIEAGIIQKPSISKAARHKIQRTYNLWQQQTGLSMAEISRILAFSIDAPRE
ncbi:MAG TPA: DNA-3-methyladenine glycosylase I [Geopsychrobacteraceae bacterium]|nr:DNA-3-methyladenine glycosylase I [Geopsychrobacteraceae bacterium]